MLKKVVPATKIIYGQPSLIWIDFSNYNTTYTYVRLLQ